MTNPPKNDTPDKALVERAMAFEWQRSSYTDLWDWMTEARATLSQPQHGGLVDSDRAIEIAAAYYANNQGERSIPFARGIIAALSNSPVVGEDCSHEAWDSNIHGESVCVDCGKYLGIKPTPTDTADTPPASGLVDALRRMADTGDHGEKALDGKSCRRLAREALAALVGDMSDAEKVDALWGANDMKLRGGRPASECPPGTNTLRRAAPTDTADRREEDIVDRLRENHKNNEATPCPTGISNDVWQSIPAYLRPSLAKSIAALIAGPPKGYMMVKREHIEAAAKEFGLLAPGNPATAILQALVRPTGEAA